MPRPETANVLADAERRNAALGHENLGPLSQSHGFFTLRRPEHRLPGPYQAWVDAADELPELVRSMRVRPRLDELEPLDATALEDRHLLRAASVLALLAHAYANVPMRAADRLPDAIVAPWLQITDRLGRPARTLTNSDLLFHNWRLVDPTGPVDAENMRLLTPIWDHPEMEMFVAVLVELLARSAPLVGATVRAQQACLDDDREVLKAELTLMGDTVRTLTRDSLPKISANSRSGTRRIDPVSWTKLFAMIPLPVGGAPPDARNASGAETPYFHLLDVVLGRRKYDTQLGHEAKAFRAGHPQHWRDFITAAGEVSIAEHAARLGDRELIGLLAELAEAYHGRNGLLARHRLKAFAYMDAAFKTGRGSTVTGFSGRFDDRAWEALDASFEAARLERVQAAPVVGHVARVESVGELCPGVTGVRLDVRELGLRCVPGDRCAVHPVNDAEVVQRTLTALRATGDEPVDMTAEWMAALPRRGRRGLPILPVREVLALGHIRPVARATAKALLALSQSSALREIVEARTEDQWELWDLLELLAGSGFAPQRLWRAERGDHESICRIVPPLEPRLYSISGISRGGIELTAGHLRYESTVGPQRAGTASSHLARLHADDPVAIGIVHPQAFSLPDDPAVPIVMLAGGTGVAPFLAFLEDRAWTPGSENLLLAGARDPASLPHREALEEYATRGVAEVQFAFSRDPVRPLRVDDLLREPATAARLRELLDAGARVYVCGRATFARRMLDAFGEIVGREAVLDLIARERYMHDVFTTYTGPAATPKRHVEASELAAHSSPEDGLWMAIAGRVYDLTEMAQLHPGGHKLIQSFAGTDAGASYRLVEHHRDPEVEALLSMFEIGGMRRLDLGTAWAVAVGDRGLEHLSLQDLFRRWLHSLYGLVEIENAFRLEASIDTEPLCAAEFGRVAETPPTPYRQQFGLEGHERFLSQTVPMVCRRLSRLWQTTSGPCSPATDAHELRAAFDAVLASEAAERAAGACTAAAPGDPGLAETLAAFRRRDCALLRDAKLLVAEGVRAFEAHESAVLATDELLVPLRRAPALVRDYFGALVTTRGG